MNTVKEIQKEAAECLSGKRFRHTQGVAECAKKLAAFYHCPQEDAVLAGYLHDLCKEVPLSQMQELTKDLALDDWMRSQGALLHGPAAAEYGKKKYGISDEVYDAVFYHTTGKANMPLLTKIIFLADYIEPGRNMACVESMRKNAYEDLNASILEGLDETMLHLIHKKFPIHKNTLIARNYLLSCR